MSSRKLDASHFSEDILEFISLLHSQGLRYVVVGGEAAIYYGHARLTGDIDFFYDIEKTNADALYDILLSFWDGDVPGMRSAAELLEPGVIIQFGRPPNRIDLLNQIDGVTFEQAWENRITAEIFAREDPIQIHYLGLSELMTNKSVSARPKDLEDLRFLQRLPSFFGDMPGSE